MLFYFISFKQSEQGKYEGCSDFCINNLMEETIRGMERITLNTPMIGRCDDNVVKS